MTTTSTTSTRGPNFVAPPQSERLLNESQCNGGNCDPEPTVPPVSQNPNIGIGRTTRSTGAGSPQDLRPTEAPFSGSLIDGTVSTRGPEQTTSLATQTAVSLPTAVEATSSGRGSNLSSGAIAGIAIAA